MEYQTRKQKEFEKIYRAYQHAVYGISLYFTKDELAAEEITQKVFYELYLHFDGANVKYIYSYLYSAAKHTAYNWTQSHKRLVYVDNMEILENEYLATITVEDIYFREEQKKAAKDLRDSILERLHQKNELWYEAVYLVYCLEKPHGQVAKELGVSKDGLHSRLYRANKWVRKNYREEYDDILSWPC